MIRAFGLPHFGQTSRWGAGTLGVLLRFGRRSAWMVSGCIGIPPIISKSRDCVRRNLHTFHDLRVGILARLFAQARTLASEC
jgi:hypothetical protein